MNDLQSIYENLTIKQLRELLAMAGALQPATSTQPSPYVGRHVIVRTYSAGVHFGVLIGHKGREVELSSAKRIWRWFGANTLHEIALRGVSGESKVSEPVASILLTEAIEIIPCSAEAAKILEGAKWAK